MPKGGRASPGRLCGPTGRIVPQESRGQYDIEVEGDLAPLLGIAQNENGPREGAASGGDPPVMRAVGAGIGFEPMTFRL
jgi:hypothetical protein